MTRGEKDKPLLQHCRRLRYSWPSWRHPIAYLLVLAAGVSTLSYVATRTAQGGTTPSAKGSTPQSLFATGDDLVDGLSDTDMKMAEFAYQNQKGERFKPVSTELASFGANWPCFWGETAVGDLATWQEHWNIFKDGWKYVCGLAHITEPCVVYSLGSAGNIAFEKDLLTRKPFCEIHVFDKSLPSSSKERWFSDEQRGNVVTHEMFIATEDDLAASPPRRSLPSIMAELNHSHIDILKMDIEGAEWGIFGTPDGEHESKVELNFMGQLLIEVHTNQGHNATADAKTNLLRLFERLESGGLRLFHKETNFRYAPLTCIEFAFIQKEWSPSRKIY